MMNQPLVSGLRQLWVSRPNPDGEQMALMAKDAGLIPWQMPVMDIFWLTPSHEQLRAMMMADLAIITSRYSLQGLAKAGLSLPRQAQFLAVGKATGQALTKLGVEAEVPEREDSEGLLALDSLTQVEGKRIVLIKGEGGRKTLLKNLTHRGALVTEVYVYRRLCIPVDQSLLAGFLKQETTVVSAASVDSLNCAIAAVPERKKAALLRMPLVVLSQRIADYAASIGWQGEVLVAPSMSSQGLIDAALTIRCDGEECIV